jgi:hypothetical protein
LEGVEYPAVNANWLILDYVAVCEPRAEILASEDFIPLWIAATETIPLGVERENT